MSVLTYPHADANGTVWLDSTGYQMATGKPCFICGASTLRWDGIHSAPFCNGRDCQQSVSNNIRLLGEPNPFSSWENEGGHV